MEELETETEPQMAFSTPTKAKRRRFSNGQRMAMVRNVKRRLDAGVSIRKACQELNIQPKQYRDWEKNTPKMREHRLMARSLHKGSPSILDGIEEELLRFIFELREQGMAVSISMVVMKACKLMRTFREKSRRARYHIVRRWIKHHSLVHRMGTHESQKSPSEMQSVATDYMEVVRPLLSQSNLSKDYTFNMDQTPVPFTFNAKSTLEKIGTTSVHIRKSTNDTKSSL